MRKGIVSYVPPNVLNELEQIMKEENIDKRRDGFFKMVEYCRVGREMEKMKDRFLLRDLGKK